MARRDRGVEEALPGVGVGGHHGRHSALAYQRFQRLPARQQRAVQEILPIEVQAIEPPHRQVGAAPAKAAHGVLEHLGSVAVTHANDFAIEHEPLGRHGPDEGDHAREATCRIVEVPGEQPHLVAVSVGLYASPIKLPFHRPQSPDHGARHVGGGHRQHGLDGPQHLQPHGRQPGLTLDAPNHRHRAQVTGHHQGPPYCCRGDRCRPGHGVGDHPLEGALA